MAKLKPIGFGEEFFRPFHPSLGYAVKTRVNFVGGVPCSGAREKFEWTMMMPSMGLMVVGDALVRTSGPDKQYVM